MKHWLLVVSLLCFGSTVMAQTIETDNSLKNLVAQKLKETETGYSVGFDAKQGATVTLPVWKIHDGSNNDVLELLNIGAESRQGQKAHGIIDSAFNVVWLSGKVWSFKWAQDHVTRTSMPPVFIGIGPALPMDILEINKMTIKNSLRATIRFRFDAVIGK